MDLQKFVRGVELFQDSLIERVGDRAVDLTYYSFAFIFIYFGIQKPAPVISPPRVPIETAITEIGFPIGLEALIFFVGAYEIVLGSMFLLKKVKLVFWPFLLHQATGFLVLLIIPFEVFQAPWVELAGSSFPFYLGSFSAFVFKNLIFLSAFLMLYRAELEGQTES